MIVSFEPRSAQPSVKLMSMKATTITIQTSHQPIMIIRTGWVNHIGCILLSLIQAHDTVTLKITKEKQKQTNLWISGCETRLQTILPRRVRSTCQKSALWCYLSWRTTSISWFRFQFNPHWSIDAHFLLCLFYRFCNNQMESSPTRRKVQRNTTNRSATESAIRQTIRNNQIRIWPYETHRTNQANFMTMYTFLFVKSLF